MIRNILVVASLLCFGSPVLAGGDAAKGAELSKTCAACHGADGNSTIPSNPVLAGQYESYIAKALSDYKSGGRQNATMAGFAAALSEQDIRDLAAYFSSQESSLTIPNR
ncbi:hypothetical protein AB833_11150 [Chromatiales bacterium (ex Bugula neritina AB1)]|nr:hypothetical protein AB833_11150 [Chromatiales bacterium (ex Bugula neritina AB1)]